MLDEKEEIIDGKKFILSHFPATVGREIFLTLPVANMPKIGDYKSSEDVMLKIMSYVQVELTAGGRTAKQALSNIDLINNHVPNAEMLLKIERAMLAYNYDFFSSGRAWTLLDQIVEIGGKLFTQMLTALSDSSSQAGK